MLVKNPRTSTQQTREFDKQAESELAVRQTLEEVYNSIKEKGYDPVKQLVGYIISEDPTYITNFEGARTKITRLDRDELLAVLIKHYLHL